MHSDLAFFSYIILGVTFLSGHSIDGPLQMCVGSWIDGQVGLSVIWLVNWAFGPVVFFKHCLSEAESS